MPRRPSLMVRTVKEVLEKIALNCREATLLPWLCRVHGMLSELRPPLFIKAMHEHTAFASIVNPTSVP